MSAKIPKEIQIKGKLWRIDYKWNLMLDGMRCNVITDFGTRTIWLDRLASKETKWAALLHEIVHATLYEAHLHEDGGVDGFVEEAICAAVADVFDSLFDMKWRRKRE